MGRHSALGQMWSEKIVDYGEARYFRTLSHIGKSIIDSVEATGADVFGGKIYETPFLCGAIWAEHYDAVGTVATFYL